MVGVAARLPGRRGRASSWQCAARHGRPARAFRHSHLRLQRCDRPRSVQAAVGGDLSGQRGAASGRRRRRHPRGGRKPWSPRSPPLHPGRVPPSPRPAPWPRDARNRPGQAHLPLGQPQYPVQPDPAQPRGRRQDQHDVASQSPSPAVPHRSRDDVDVGVPLPAQTGLRRTGCYVIVLLRDKHAPGLQPIRQGAPYTNERPWLFPLLVQVLSGQPDEGVFQG
jgi:hypothetical protein